MIVLYLTITIWFFIHSLDVLDNPRFHRQLLRGTWFSKLIRVCASVSTVLPLSSRFTGQFFAAVPNIQVSSCVSWSFVPVYTACVFVELISGPVCCLHRQISIWTGVGENLSAVSHLCLFLATSRHGW